MSIASEPDPRSGSPVGVRVDATPAHRPGSMVLEGRFGRVEKLDAARHSAALAEAVLGWRWPLLLSITAARLRFRMSRQADRARRFIGRLPKKHSTHLGNTAPASKSP
jgi:hypothetical protein